MNSTVRASRTVLAAGGVLIAVSLTAPAFARDRDRRREHREHHASQPFAYVRAADAARGRVHRETHSVRPRHRPARPFAYIRAADKRQRPDRHQRDEHHDRRP